ncbi:unnamed protein product [Acanthoscelides obtectus]|uniref:Uncharacterized protein n=1 Tax=Acanthoscelides obtectus TaxID=200917 RepID=A0A9P0Q5Y0_ACAOB|nr:unnamed protein product [Acanthoscelides obtectus]CAK1627273.1 hypothetical protein AOBTE_LOCUS4464 [Acanthoscelides obtectus]
MTHLLLKSLMYFLQCPKFLRSLKRTRTTRRSTRTSTRTRKTLPAVKHFA